MRLHHNGTILIKVEQADIAADGRFIVPDSVTHIGVSAFDRCTNLTEVIFNAGLTHIGAWAFDGCTNLTEVIFNAGLTHIGEWAFRGCTDLTEVIFNAGLTYAYIGESAFAGCQNLTEVILPESLTHGIIEPNALASFADKGNIFIIGRDQENDLKRIRTLLPWNLGGKVSLIDLKISEKVVSYPLYTTKFIVEM